MICAARTFSYSGEARFVQSTRSHLQTPYAPGLIAGAVGGILIDAYLLVTVVAIAHRTTVAGFYQFVASSAIGRAAYGEPQAVLLGIALHALVSVAWGFGFAYVAVRTPQIVARPLTSGIVYGVVVMLAMQLVEVAANVYTLPDTFTLLNSFVAHTIFFGIPIAYVVVRRLGTPS
jgi:hypothetical protein